ncbi:hypothetical protein Q6332_31060, partial [Klebsiella pneumoniae]|uniref:hypothetical protein n=1 Tax=Klebsiella pneumoniae TaxID=573 RepID=UPI0027310D2D
HLSSLLPPLSTPHHSGATLRPECYFVTIKQQKNNMPPKAKLIPHAMTLHCDTLIDNYYCLRDDERARPDVL